MPSVCRCGGERGMVMHDTVGKVVAVFIVDDREVHGMMSDIHLHNGGSEPRHGARWCGRQRTGQRCSGTVMSRRCVDTLLRDVITAAMHMDTAAATRTRTRFIGVDEMVTQMARAH